MDENRRRATLQAMGLPVWLPKDSEPAPVAPQQEARVRPSGNEIPAVEATARGPNLLADACARAEQCTACALHETRTKSVFGVGAPDARCMFIGEGPGAEEDRRGEPFVGRAGRLLNAMLSAINIERESVYIANIVKCRPPNNRDPRPEEVASCDTFLRTQIECIKPRVLVALGRVAAQNLLGSTTPLGRLRRDKHVYPGTETPLVVTYHPAYLLRSPKEKAKAWQDLKLIRSLLVGS